MSLIYILPQVLELAAVLIQNGAGFQTSPKDISMKRLFSVALVLLMSSSFAHAADVSAVTALTESSKAYQSGALTDMRPDQDSIVTPQPVSNPGSVEPAAGAVEVEFAPDEMMEGREAIQMLQVEPSPQQ